MSDAGQEMQPSNLSSHFAALAQQNPVINARRVFAYEGWDIKADGTLVNHGEDRNLGIPRDVIGIGYKTKDLDDAIEKYRREHPNEKYDELKITFKFNNGASDTTYCPPITKPTKAEIAGATETTTLFPEGIDQAYEAIKQKECNAISAPIHVSNPSSVPFKLFYEDW